MISITSTGNYKKATDFLKGLRTVGAGDVTLRLPHYGRLGVDALEKATPVRSGITANAWRYRIVKDRRGPKLEWYNENVVDGFPVVILIQYGHATGTGGYVAGEDFINPAIKPIFDKIVEDFRRKVR